MDEYVYFAQMVPKVIHILVADDDEEDLELLEECLLNIKPDTRLHMVRNGRAAIEYLNSKQQDDLPCLIVLDYSMPELNGLQVLSILGSDSRLRTIPVVLLSTSNSPRHINDCKEKGAVDYLIKPNSINELAKIAEKIISLCN